MRRKKKYTAKFLKQRTRQRLRSLGMYGDILIRIACTRTTGTKVPISQRATITNLTSSPLNRGNCNFPKNTMRLQRLKYLNEKDFQNNVFSSRRRHTRLVSDWSSDVCSSD